MAVSQSDQKNHPDLRLSIVVPLYNEEESLEKLHTRILEVARTFDFGYEIIYVDDGSSDNTWELIEGFKKKTPQLKGIKLRRNYGQTSAMVAGFDHSSGEIIITLDGDLQNDPGDIPMVLDKMDEGYDIVSGWRKFRQDHTSRVLPSKVANFLISKTTGVKLHDYGCSLKAYRSECIKSIHGYGEMHRFFPALASMTGARVIEIPVQHHPRKYGVSKYGFERIFKVFSDIFSMNLIIRFSGRPLKGFGFCSAPFFVLALLFGIFAVIAFGLDWTEGKTNFFLFIMALNLVAGVHLAALGVLGELIVHLSDLTHTQLPMLTRRKLLFKKNIGKENDTP